ncbi:MAG: hypothetical protein R6X02_02700 [Enhygromyxa sp.]
MVKQAISKRITTVALALALAACKGKGDEAGASEATPDAASKPGDAELEAKDPGKAEGTEAPQAGDQEPDDPRAAALTITRSESASTIAGKGVSSLGFNLGKISHLFALAATAKVPEWGAAGTSEPKLARDDDLNSAWQCEFGEAKPCVLGLALPEKAKIEAVRLYGAAGPRYRDYTAHPRLARVRVHTEAGYVEASLSDGANHNYVRFDAPIETQYLAIEVLETHPGKSGALVHIAEVEAYGTDGAPRQPIELDPDFAYSSWETGVWSSGKGNHTIRQVFLEFARPGQGADGQPGSRRFLRATAVFGQAGDDYLLFERLHRTDCSETRGSYVLFDRRNRMFYPLGDLGGAGAEVYRHADGRGFAVGWMGMGGFTIKGVVEEAGAFKWKRPPKQAPGDGAALLREWGFETKPLSRGLPIDGVIPGCHRAAFGELDPLIAAAKFKQASAEDPTKWVVCSVGEDKLYASAACGKPARAYQLSGGKLVGKHEGKKDDARGLRLRRVGDRLLVELSTGADSGALLWAEPGRLLELGTGGLFVRPPAACGECVDTWPNPTGPDPEAFADDDWRDEGSYDEDEDDEDYADEGNDESLPHEDFDEDADEDENEDENEDEGDEQEDAQGPPRARPVLPKPPAPTPG